MRNYRPIFPNLFTVANMFCGFLALIAASDGEYQNAAWLIILAGFLDALDGKVARLAGGATDIGKELDSLADVISFGVAPAFLIYSINLNAFGRWGWIVGLIYIVASAYRLARFNLLAASDEKKDFLGLPAPVAAVTLAAYILMSIEIWGEVRFGEYVITMIILFSALMVSQIEYYALPESFNTRANRLKLLYIVLLALAMMYKPKLLIFPFFAVYIIYGLIHEAVRIIRQTASTNRRNNNSKNGEQIQRD